MKIIADMKQINLQNILNNLGILDLMQQILGDDCNVQGIMNQNMMKMLETLKSYIDSFLMMLKTTGSNAKSKMTSAMDATGGKSTGKKGGNAVSPAASASNVGGGGGPRSRAASSWAYGGYGQ